MELKGKTLKKENLFLFSCTKTRTLPTIIFPSDLILVEKHRGGKILIVRPEMKGGGLLK